MALAVPQPAACTALHPGPSPSVAPNSTARLGSRIPKQLTRLPTRDGCGDGDLLCVGSGLPHGALLRLSGEGGGLRSAFAARQCSCGRSSSALFGAPILRVERQSHTLRQRGPVQPSAVKYEYKSSKNPSDISQAPLSSSGNLSLIKDAKIEAQPPQDLKLRLRVDLSGKDTQKAFDTVVRSLAKNAPPVPGFRKAKGGKTSIVPTSVLLNMMGVSRVRKFVIEEIVRTVLVEYVEKEGIKAKKNLATDKNADELDAIFEPGRDFGFDATLDLEEDSGDAETKAEAEASESEVVSA